MSKRLKTLVVLCVFSAFGLILGSCRENHLEIPDGAEIIYTTGPNWTIEVGFTNADGSLQQSVEPPLNIHEVLWNSDNRILAIYPASGQNRSYVHRVNGSLIFGSEENGIGFVDCEGTSFRVANFVNGRDNEALVISIDGLQILDLQTCEVIETLYASQDVMEENVDSASISINGDWLVYSLLRYRNYIGTLVLLDVSTNELTTLGSGRHPAISPDGNWISFVRDDGIYISRRDGTETRRLVEIAIHIGGMPPYIEGIPYPRWSPDSMYILFHDPPEGERTYPPMDAVIKMVDIETGEIIVLVEGGAYPFWKGGR